MTETQIHVDAELDARGLLCPMPIVKTAKAIKELAPGQVLKLVATDRGSLADVPAWAEQTGNAVVAQHDDGSEFTFYLRKG